MNANFHFRLKNFFPTIFPALLESKAEPAICNHLVYLIWRVKYCGCRGRIPLPLAFCFPRHSTLDECLFVLLMSLAESPGKYATHFTQPASSWPRAILLHCQFNGVEMLYEVKSAAAASAFAFAFASNFTCSDTFTATDTDTYTDTDTDTSSSMFLCRILAPPVRCK